MLAHDLPLMSPPPRHKPSPRQRMSMPRQRPSALTLAALSHLPEIGDFAAWRGRSGRRYVVTRHALNDDVILSWPGIVLIAVRQTTSGAAPTLVGVFETGCETPGAQVASPAPQPCPALLSWLTLMRMSGATCLDVHLGLTDPALRSEAVADLAP